MKKLLAILALLPSLALAQPSGWVASPQLPSGQTRNASEVIDTCASRVPIATTDIAAGSTNKVIKVVSNLTSTVYRGDIAYVTKIPSFTFNPDGQSIPVESVSATEVRLSSPLAFVPPAAGQVAIFRCSPLPLVLDGFSNTPYLPVSGTFGISSSSFYDGLLIDPVYYGLGILGSDGSAYRAIKAANSAPGASDYGLVVRGVGTFAATQSGAWTNACTQSGAWTVTANLGTLNGAATAALQSAGNSSLSSIDSQIASLHENDAVNGKGEVWKNGMWDSANGSWRGLEGDSNGNLKVIAQQDGDYTTVPKAISWGTVTRTTITTTAAVAASANASRKALSLWNESGGQIKWTFNGTASATNYQGIISTGQGIIFEGSTNSTQALSIVAVSGTVTYTISEAS